MVTVNRGKQLDIWNEMGIGINFNDAIEIALESINTQTKGYKRKVMAYSGGKDSSTAVGFMAWAIEQGLVDLDPKDVYIVYSDTGRELPPLHEQAMHFLSVLEAKGFNTKVVAPPLDKSFFVQVLGRGLPIPWAMSRWCVTSLKVNAMDKYVRELFYGDDYPLYQQLMNRNSHLLQESFDVDITGEEETNVAITNKRDALKLADLDRGKEKLLVITGVRKGESIARDTRIEAVCSRDGECGTGLWQPSTKWYDRLAPLLKWRTCHVFEFLNDWMDIYDLPHHNLPTQQVAKIYGDRDIRTGCMVCSVASHDHALEYVISHLKDYAYLAPMLKLYRLWKILEHRRDLRLFNDGTAKSQSKDLGPLTFEARKFAFDFVMEVQEEIFKLGGNYRIMTDEQIERINWHWDNQTWPNGWDGTQPVGNYKQKLVKSGQLEFEMFGG